MEAVSRENSFREFCSKERNEGEVGGKWSEEKFFLVLFVFQRERKNSLFLCCSEYCMTQCGGSEKGRVAGAVVLKREEGKCTRGGMASAGSTGGSLSVTGKRWRASVQAIVGMCGGIHGRAFLWL